jgi:mannitol/fructose-specific phosphotransferase system IIA component (Ntr-type)
MFERNCLKTVSVKCLKSHEKLAAIRELIYGTSLSTQVKNAGELERAILEREKEQSTGLGNGIAFAHGKTRAVDSPLFALGISKEGIPFDSMDGKPVKFLFLIASPPEMQEEYLNLLSIIAVLCHNEDLKKKILSIDSQPQIEECLAEEFRTLVFARDFLTRF